MRMDTLTAYMDTTDMDAITFDSSDNSDSSQLNNHGGKRYQFLSTAMGSTSFSSSLYSPGLSRFQSKD